MTSRAFRRKKKGSLCIAAKGAHSPAFRRSVIDYILGPVEDALSSCDSSKNDDVETEVARRSVFWQRQKENNANIGDEADTTATVAQGTVVPLSDDSQDIFTCLQPFYSSDMCEGETRLQACNPITPRQINEDLSLGATAEHANAAVQEVNTSNSCSSDIIDEARCHKGNENGERPEKASRATRIIFSPRRRRTNTTTSSTGTSIGPRKLASRDEKRHNKTASQATKMPKYLLRRRRKNTNNSIAKAQRNASAEERVLSSCSSNEDDAETERASRATSAIIPRRRRTNNARAAVRATSSAQIVAVNSDSKEGNGATNTMFLPRRREHISLVRDAASSEKKQEDGTTGVASRETKIRFSARRRTNNTTYDLTDTTTAREQTSSSSERKDEHEKTEIPVRVPSIGSPDASTVAQKVSSSSDDDGETNVASQVTRMSFSPPRRKRSTTRRIAKRKTAYRDSVVAQDTASSRGSNDVAAEAKIVENRPTLPSFARIIPQARKTPKSDRFVSVSTCSRRESVLAVGAAIKRLGWKQKPPKSLDASIVWLGIHASPENLTPYQIYSKIEGFDLLCKKSAMAALVNLMHDAFPHLFQFMPKTWILRWDKFDQAMALAQTMREKKGSTFICKPSGGSFGRGIRLVKKWADLKRIMKQIWPIEENKWKHRQKRPEYVIQRYISRPLLVDGYKFDLRVYVVVTSILPLTAYIFDEGHGRFCTHQYKKPREENLKDPFMHVTNCNVNARSGKFQSSRAHDRGSKRSLSSILEWVELHNGPNAATMFASIKELCERTLMALLPGLIMQYSTRGPTVGLHPHGPKGFQLIGFDILFEENHRIRLIEVNSNPSMSCMLPTADPTSQHNVQMPKHYGKRRKMEVSAVDFAVKVELIAQAMLISNPMPHQEVMRGKQEFLGRSGGLPCGAAFSEPIPSLDQRRVANPSRRVDNPEAAPALQPLVFSRKIYRPIREAIDAYDALYRVFRDLTTASSLLFDQCAFRAQCEQYKFFTGEGSMRFFEDLVEANAFFAVALRQAQKDAGSTKEFTGLYYPQFLLYICVPLGKTLDPQSDLHALMAITKLRPVSEDSTETTSSTDDASIGASQRGSLKSRKTKTRQYGPSTIWDATPPTSDHDVAACVE
eukprot:GEMP01002471.1.p1 GENE.GEMP01002471.1~~GEMP01002471.1.p1  ORF type:complete len:1127 (+),score=211.50 GEMP01002471.1:178-3558(+)